MRKIKSYASQLWLYKLLFKPRITYETLTIDNINYVIVKIRSDYIPDRITVNKFNIPVQPLDDTDDIPLPSLMDGLQCYGSSMLGGLVVIAMAGIASAYCKAIIIASA